MLYVNQHWRSRLCARISWGAGWCCIGKTQQISFFLSLVFQQCTVSELKSDFCLSSSKKKAADIWPCSFLSDRSDMYLDFAFLLALSALTSPFSLVPQCLSDTHTVRSLISIVEESLLIWSSSKSYPSLRLFIVHRLGCSPVDAGGRFPKWNQWRIRSFSARQTEHFAIRDVSTAGSRDRFYEGQYDFH